VSGIRVEKPEDLKPDTYNQTAVAILTNNSLDSNPIAFIATGYQGRSQR